MAAISKYFSGSNNRTLEALKHKSAATLATIAATFCSINIEAHHKSHRKPTDIPQISLFCSMLALIPQSGDFSLCLGRLGLPDRLPFSKPKVNWLLHTRSAFRRTPSGRLIYKSLFLYQRYTKGIEKASIY